MGVTLTLSVGMASCWGCQNQCPSLSSWSCSLHSLPFLMLPKHPWCSDHCVDVSVSLAKGPSDSPCSPLRWLTWRCDSDIHSSLVALTYQEKSSLFSSGLLLLWFHLSGSHDFPIQTKLGTSYPVPRQEENISLPEKLLYPKSFILGNHWLWRAGGSPWLSHFRVRWHSKFVFNNRLSWVPNQISDWPISMAKPLRTGSISDWAGAQTDRSLGHVSSRLVLFDMQGNLEIWYVFECL